MKKLIFVIIIIIILIAGMLYYKPLQVINLFGIGKYNDNIEYRNFIMKMPNALEIFLSIKSTDGKPYAVWFDDYEHDFLNTNDYYFKKLKNYFSKFKVNEYSTKKNYYNIGKNDVLGEKNYYYEKIYFVKTKNEQKLIILSFSHSKGLSDTFDAYFNVLKQKNAFNKKGALSCDKSENKCFSVYDFNKFNVKQITEIVGKRYFAYTFKIDYNLFIHVLYIKIDKEYDNKIYKDLLDSIFEASKKYNSKINKKDDKDLLKIGSDFWK